MATVTATYLGDLRVECTHVDSGTTIITDAPKDNQGKGESFSPTDLCATSLAACAMTIMGIYGQTHGVDLKGTRISITKVMSASPRRIGEIKIVFTMPEHPFSEKEKKSLEHAMHSCPVHLSLHPDVARTISFEWPQ